MWPLGYRQRLDRDDPLDNASAGRGRTAYRSRCLFST
jgi:hypothetical protein